MYFHSLTSSLNILFVLFSLLDLMVSDCLPPEIALWTVGVSFIPAFHAMVMHIMPTHAPGDLAPSLGRIICAGQTGYLNTRVTDRTPPVASLPTPIRNHGNLYHLKSAFHFFFCHGHKISKPNLFLLLIQTQNPPKSNQQIPTLSPPPKNSFFSQRLTNLQYNNYINYPTETFTPRRPRPLRSCTQQQKFSGSIEKVVPCQKYTKYPKQKIRSYFTNPALITYDGSCLGRPWRFAKPAHWRYQTN
jgi:hypothetical protein